MQGTLIAGGVIPGMDEQAVLARLADYLPAAGDDAAVIEDLLLTTDMLHESTDFPAGTTPYTAGWRAVGASLSDIAAMGGQPLGTLCVFGTPTFEWEAISTFVDGARDVSAAVNAEYVGGDLDSHGELTLASTAVGRAVDPVRRAGASPGDVVCVTGTLGRSALAIRHFADGDQEAANELFRFHPRIEAGQRLAADATAMIDSSDGLARSVHQLANASDCGIELESPLPIDERLAEVFSPAERRDRGLFFGEDFELVCTLPPEWVDTAREDLDVALTPVGTVTEGAVTLDGDPLPDRGYTHE